jgi:transcriptional regulator with XRE-family HTH domain
MKIDATKLKALRQKKSWTQEDLAEHANVHPRTVQRAESTSFASSRTSKFFADALKKAHPALLISNLNEFLKLLSDSGYEVIYDRNMPGVERAFIHDPFGNRIELIQHLD